MLALANRIITSVPFAWTNCGCSLLGIPGYFEDWDAWPQFAQALTNMGLYQQVAPFAFYGGIAGLIVWVLARSNTLVQAKLRNRRSERASTAANVSVAAPDIQTQSASVDQRGALLVEWLKRDTVSLIEAAYLVRCDVPTSLSMTTPFDVQVEVQRLRFAIRMGYLKVDPPLQGEPGLSTKIAPRSLIRYAARDLLRYAEFIDFVASQGLGA